MSATAESITLPSIEIDAWTLKTEIPEAMQLARRWLLWRYEPPEQPTGKPRKVPYYCNGSRRHGQTDNEADWSRLVTMAEALAAAERRPGFGLGFALGPDGEGRHWQGIDLDDIDQRPELTALVERLPGYVERSPSGNGAHAYGLGAPFRTLGSNRTGIECYAAGRYFAVTGDSVQGDLEDLSEFVTKNLAPMHSPAGAAGARASAPPPADSFFAKVNAKALTSLSAWVPALFPDARVYHDGYRVASADLGRDLEEDISILPRGSRDFGEERGASPINLVIEWGPATDAPSAALWLCDQMGIDPAALGWQGPDPRAQADPSDILTQAIDRLAADPGAVLTEAAVTAWREVYDQSAAEYERLRAKAKKAGARVAEIDRAIGARSKYAKKRGGREKNTKLSSSYTPYTLNTDKGSGDIETYTDPFLSYTSCTHTLPVQPGALVKETEHGARLKIASDAALTVASALKDRFAYCPTAQTWHGFTGAHWEPMANPAPLHEALTRWMYPATGELGFTPRYQDSILLLIQRAAMRPLPAPSRAIPFANGLLDLETRALVPIAPGNALTWSLPYDYREGADCPRIKAWLLEAVGGDHAVRELLRAFLSAAIRGGAHLQRFLHLIGPGGTGKSTLLRLIEALVGTRNAVSTDLTNLEQNRFEAASLYGKRAALITDSDKYGGSVNKLKAITGQDPIRLERKHVQQSGSFIFDGLVFLASNEPLATTDYTSGLERRRVTVAFGRRVSDEEKAAWDARGGEMAVLHAELPGLVNWLLAMPQAEAERIIRNPPTAVTRANLEAMCAGNPAADWLTEWCIPDPDAWVQVGKCVELKDRDTGRTFFEHQEFMLYPNYLAWCKASGRTALSLRRFRSVVVDAVKTLGHDVLELRRSQGQGVQGIRLRAPTEDPYTWLSVQSDVGSAGDVGSDTASYTPPDRASVECAGDVGFCDQITPAHFCARTHAASAEFQAPDAHPDVLAYLDRLRETDPDIRADLIRRASEDSAVLRSIRAALRAAP